MVHVWMMAYGIGEKQRERERRWGWEGERETETLTPTASVDVAKRISMPPSMNDLSNRDLSSKSRPPWWYPTPLRQSSKAPIVSERDSCMHDGTCRWVSCLEILFLGVEWIEAWILGPRVPQPWLHSVVWSKTRTSQSQHKHRCHACLWASLPPARAFLLNTCQWACSVYPEGEGEGGRERNATMTSFMYSGGSLYVTCSLARHQI